MTFGKFDDKTYILRLERGEEILSTLKAFCKSQNIQNASISGIGSIENPTLAHYRVDSKKYSEKELEGIFEVTSLLGTVALFEKEPLLHLHTTLGDEEMKAWAGHLVKGDVSATLEVTIEKHTTAFTKSPSEEIGLKLYDLPENSTN